MKYTVKLIQDGTYGVYDSDLLEAESERPFPCFEGSVAECEAWIRINN